MKVVRGQEIRGAAYSVAKGNLVFFYGNEEGELYLSSSVFGFLARRAATSRLPLTPSFRFRPNRRHADLRDQVFMRDSCVGINTQRYSHILEHVLGGLLVTVHEFVFYV